MASSCSGALPTSQVRRATSSVSCTPSNAFTASGATMSCNSILAPTGQPRTPRSSASAADGFYSPSQLVHDAKRHGVKVASIDVTISGWDSVLERQLEETPAIVRRRLSLLKGLRDGSAERIENARAVKAFESVSLLARRAHLDRLDLQVLAAANASRSLAGYRRDALWQREGEIRHLIAQWLVDMSRLLSGMTTLSRNFFLITSGDRLMSTQSGCSMRCDSWTFSISSIRALRPCA
jgi:hypothetical protein